MAILALAAPARADGAPTLDDLLRHAGAIRGDDAAARERAVGYLSTLPEEALPAIAERLAQTRRQIIPEEDGYDALRFFRHATGSLRADDMVDIVPGILPVLEERRTPVIGRTAERLLYMRSLEAIGTLEAQRMIGDILALTSRMWRWERRRLVARHGVSLLPGLIVLRNHPESPVRVWARWAIEELGMTQPAEALQQEDPMLVARILEAYGEARDMDSMPVVISYVGHPAAPIREAARGAMERFAHNGIWQLRKAMRNQLGRDADHAWGWEHTARELYEGLDEARLAPLEGVLDAGLQAAEAGDVATATERLGRVLRAAPMHPRRVDIAHAYLALAETDGSPRERLVRRAGLLAPDDPQVRGAVLALEAEADLARGVLDAEAWREAARQGQPRAREVVADLLDEELPEVEGAPASADADGVSTTVWLALATLLLLGLGLRFRGRRRLAPLTGRLLRRLRPERLARLRFERSPESEPEPEPGPRPSGGAQTPGWRDRLAALRLPERVAIFLRRLTAHGVFRRLALFRRLVRGRTPPPPRPRISAREVVRRRYQKPPPPEPRIVDATGGAKVAPQHAPEPEPPEPESPEPEPQRLDALLLAGASPAPEPQPSQEPRPATTDLASLMLSAANEERAERSSPGTIAAPTAEPFSGRPGDTYRDPQPEAQPGAAGLGDLDGGATLVESPGDPHEPIGGDTLPG